MRSTGAADVVELELEDDVVVKCRRFPTAASAGFCRMGRGPFSAEGKTRQPLSHCLSPAYYRWYLERSERV